MIAIHMTKTKVNALKESQKKNKRGFHKHNLQKTISTRAYFTDKLRKYIVQKRSRVSSGVRTVNIYTISKSTGV